MSIQIAIANPKGGTAKTSTAVNLASALAITGRRVLIVDLDAQGSATVALDIKRLSPSPLLEALSVGRPLHKEEPVTYARGRFDLLPSGEDLTALPVMAHREGEESVVLAPVFQELSSLYDLILLDCPPSMGCVTDSALRFADYLIIPTHCEMLSLAAVETLLNRVAKLRVEGLSRVAVLGILRTMHDPEALSETFEDACQHLKDDGPLVFDTVIPYSSRVSEASASGKPVIYYDRSSLGARAYLTFAGEFIAALEGAAAKASD